MPYGKLETLQDCQDFVRGCLFMGTGGGGSVNEGMEMLTEALNDGLTLEWVDAATIPDDVISTTIFGMGSIAPTTQETLDEIDRMGLEDKFGHMAIAETVKELEAFTGKRVGCIVPVELGASNTPGPLVAAARLGIPVVDGDYAGRAVPDEMQGTPFIHGKMGWPAVSVDQWGNAIYIKNAPNAYMFERVGKMLAIAAFGHTMMATNAFPGYEMKELIVPDTLTKCLKLGRAIRLAREKGEDPIEAAISETGGWRLFEGIVAKKEWEDRDGYMYGTNYLDGTGDWSGQTLNVWVKKENHVTWLNDKPWVCSPDLVTLAHKHSGEGTTNTLITKGDEVVAVGMKGLEIFRTEFGLNKASGPRYFGFDIDYVPIEELMAKR